MINLNTYYSQKWIMPHQIQLLIAIVFGFALGWKILEIVIVLGLQHMINSDDDSVVFDEVKETITLNIKKLRFLDRELRNDE
jgi:hypothetical protein